MTQPRNFPERKNQRRKDALEALKKQLAKDPKNEGLKDAIENTAAKIVDEGMRDVKTKKNRTKKGGR